MKNIVSKLSVLTALFISIFIVSQAFVFATVPVEAASTPTLAPLQLDSNSTITSGTSSYNWSGYVTKGGSYTSVASTWTIPQAVNPGTALASDAAWVGIGGITSRDLIQAGTLAMTDDQGNVEYEAWVETLPSEPIQIPVEIHSNDSVSVAISEAGPNTWLVTFRNNTTGLHYETTLKYRSSLSSAEWVEEMPSDGISNSFIPLNNFGTVQFTNSSTVKNGVAMTPAQAGAAPLTMHNMYDQALAIPSSLSSDGTSFSVSRTSSSSVPDTNPVQDIEPSSSSDGMITIPVPDGSSSPGIITVTITPQGIFVQ